MYILRVGPLVYRIVCVSSSIQLISNINMDDLALQNEVTNFGFQNSLPYSNSKYANSLFAKELAKKLEGTGVTTYSLCPGLVNTPLTRHTGVVLRTLMKIPGLTPQQVNYPFFTLAYLKYKCIM